MVSTSFVCFFKNKSTVENFFEAYISQPLAEDEDFIYGQRNTNSGCPKKTFQNFTRSWMLCLKSTTRLLKNIAIRR